MRPKEIAYLIMLLFLLPAVATASPYEASGTVVTVIDGKTFEIAIEKFDPRIRDDVERVTLADLEVPDESMGESMVGLVNESTNESMNTSTNQSLSGSRTELMGDVTNDSTNDSIYDRPSAKDLAVAILLNKTVWLDIDDRSLGGRNSDGELVALLYLCGLDGEAVISPSYNRMLVDYEIAELNDSLENEFDAADWWPDRENVSEENATGEEATGTEATGLNIDINPPKPNVDVDISPLNVDINPAKPNVNVSLSGLNIDVNPTQPNIDVDPGKPAVEVEAAQLNETENDTAGSVSYYDTLPSANDTSTLPYSNLSEPVVLENSTAPITLINPTGTITVINSTGQVTLINPALPVNVVNSTESS